MLIIYGAPKQENIYKEKNNISFDETHQNGYEIDMIDKIIYKEIITNLDNIGLTENEKQAFELYYINDLPIKEISNSLNNKESNIKYYLYNARKK